jgi:hypothetical protein
VNVNPKEEEIEIQDQEEDLPEELPEEEQPEEEAEGEEQPDEEAELSITIGDDEDEEHIDPDLEAELGGKGKAALAALRTAQKEAAREARKSAREAKEAKDALEALRNQISPPKEIALPTLEECGYNDNVYAQRMEEYVNAKAAKKVAEDKSREQEAAVKQDYDSRLAKYKTGKTALRVSDFDDAEDSVVSVLTQEQQSMIIRCVDDPATIIYALGKSKKTLAELASIRDWDRFAYKLAKIEGGIKVNKRTPPPPEKRMAGGSPGSSGGGALTSRLNAAEKRAEQTGDRSEVVRLKREIKALSQK